MLARLLGRVRVVATAEPFSPRKEWFRHPDKRRAKCSTLVGCENNNCVRSVSAQPDRNSQTGWSPAMLESHHSLDYSDYLATGSRHRRPASPRHRRKHTHVLGGPRCSEKRWRLRPGRHDSDVFLRLTAQSDLGRGPRAYGRNLSRIINSCLPLDWKPFQVPV
jgi:hypothetical protein